MSSDILVPIKERFWRGKVLISERHCASSASYMVDIGGIISLIFEIAKFHQKWWRQRANTVYIPIYVFDKKMY